MLPCNQSRDRLMWAVILVMFIVAVALPSPAQTSLEVNETSTQQVK